MTFLLIDDGTDRERWLAARAGEGRVSATDAARIMTGGAGTWASLRKEKATGDSGFGGNQYTRHGNDREAVIAAFGEQRFGLVPSTALLGRSGCADDALDLATPDALAMPTVDGVPLFGDLEPGVEYAVAEFGEYKTTVHDWPTWADVPARYHWQVVWQFLVTGALRCRFIFEAHEGFVPIHMEPRVFTIERADVEADIESLQAAVASWRGADVEDVPEALVPLDALLSARTRAREEAEAADARAKAAEADIRALLVAHGQVVKFEGTDANVSWTGKPVVSQRFDSKAFAAKYPAAARRFTKPSESQPRLSITARS